MQLQLSHKGYNAIMGAERHPDTIERGALIIISCVYRAISVVNCIVMILFIQILIFDMH